MPRLQSEPSSPIRSMEDLLAVAMAMEKDSAERYADLAGRMRAVGRPELAEVFDQLVSEETGHMEMVAGWSRQIGLPSERLDAGPAPEGVYDDEGIGLVSPELVDAYRSLAIAVRNEERAFAFWSYVSAQNASKEIRQAAERMAREELEHAKTLRRARRKAFFAGRRSVREPHDLAELELEICRKLEQRAEKQQGASDYRALAVEAGKLSQALASDPLQDPAPIGLPPPRSLDALCEWLADFYIEAGETLPSQAARERAQALATAAVRRLATVRHLEEGRA